MENEIEDPILAKLNANKNTEEEVDPILAQLNSPKSTAPSKIGGESGAQNTPYSSSESALKSWTTEANPLANKGVQVPLAKPIDGVEQTKIVQPKPLGSAESVKNSTKNIATQLKTAIPNSALSVVSIEDKLLGGFTYLAAKLMGKTDEEADIASKYVPNIASEVVSKVIPTSMPIDKTREGAFKQIEAYKKELLPTKGVIETYKDKDFKGMAAAVYDGMTSIVSSAVTGGATGGIGIATDMMGSSIYDFNKAKADKLGITVDELYDQNKDEVAIPATAGAVAASLEKIGLKGINKAINTKIANNGVKGIFKAILEGSKEAGTEWVQVGIETTNQSLAEGKTIEEASKDGLNVMLSEQGAEAALKGLVGSAGSVVSGKAASSLYKLASDKRKQALAPEFDKVQTLVVEKDNPNIDDATKAVLDTEIEAATNNIYQSVKEGIVDDLNISDEADSEIQKVESQKNDLIKDYEVKKALLDNPNLSDATKVIISTELAKMESEVASLESSKETIVEADKLIRLATPEATAGVTINTETDGKERREEEAKDVLTPTEEVKGMVEAAPLKDVESTQKALDELNEENDLPKIFTQNTINISDIEEESADGQKLSDAIVNVKDGLKSKTEGKILVYESGGKYYIADGFHRVAEAKLNGQKTIDADIVYAKPKDISEAYHKAKADGSNPELVKAVEELLGQKESTSVQPKQQQTNESNIQQQVDKVSSNVGAVGDIAKENEALRDVESGAKTMDDFDTFKDAVAYNVKRTTDIGIDESEANYGDAKNINEIKLDLEKAGIQVEKVSQSSMSDGNYASFDGEKIKVTDENIPLQVLLHEIGEKVVLDLDKAKQKIEHANNIFEAVTTYGASRGNDAFADNFYLYFLSPKTLKELSPNVYAELNKLIPQNIKDLGKSLMSKYGVTEQTLKYKSKIKEQSAANKEQAVITENKGEEAIKEQKSEVKEQPLLSKEQTPQPKNETKENEAVEKTEKLFATLGGKAFEVNSFEDASKKQQEFFEKMVEGREDTPYINIPLMNEKGEEVAYISQNGKVWDSKTKKVIYDPSKQVEKKEFKSSKYSNEELPLDLEIYEYENSTGKYYQVVRKEGGSVTSGFKTEQEAVNAYLKQNKTPNETKNTAITADDVQLQPTNVDSEVAKDDTKGEVKAVAQTVKAVDNKIVELKTKAAEKDLKKQKEQLTTDLNAIEDILLGKAVERKNEILNDKSISKQDKRNALAQLLSNHGQTLNEVSEVLKKEGFKVANGKVKIQIYNDGELNVSSIRDAIERVEDDFNTSMAAPTIRKESMSGRPNAVGNYSTKSSSKKSLQDAIDNLETAKAAKNKGLIDTYEKQLKLEKQKYDEVNQTAKSNERRLSEVQERIKSGKLEDRYDLKEVRTINDLKSEVDKFNESEAAPIDVDLENLKSVAETLIKKEEAALEEYIKPHLKKDGNLKAGLNNNTKGSIDRYNRNITDLKEELDVINEEIKKKAAVKETPKAAKVKQEKELNKPKSAKDVATIFRKLFNFSPKESIWAARLFDAKATFMAKVKGISKEDYYKEYWFDNEGKGGLNQVEVIKDSNYEKWKGKNKEYSGAEIQDVKTGEPVVLRVYHGTTNEFYEFDSSVKGNIEGHLGKVNYFTSDYQDASSNYLAQGADITGRVENLKERILSDLEYQVDESLEENEREDKIREVISENYPDFDSSSLDFNMELFEVADRVSSSLLLGGEEQVLDLYVKLNNPVVLGNGSTWFETLNISDSDLEQAAQEIADENDITIEEAKEDNEWEIRDRAIENTGYENLAIEALQTALSNNGYDSSMASEILGDNLYDTEIDLNKLENDLRKAELYDNENGELAGSQVIADFFKELGFDGIILTDVNERFKNMGLGGSTSHIHVFDEFNNQIKLADGRNKTFGDTSNILFQERKGSWTKEAAKMKRIISMYEKADSTTAVHEMLGHDYLDRIIEASATNKEFDADLRTIAEEYVKAKGGKVDDVIKALKDFDVENKSPKGTSVHEWFAQQAEQYFATERDVKTETPQQSKMAKIFEAFRQHLADLYDSMNKALIAPSEPMKKVFRKVFGEENFNQAEEIRTENTEVINNLNAAALEKNKKQGGLKSLADKLKEKGLGQSEYAQDIWDAASELIADKKAKRYNVTDMLKEMFPAIENDIEEMRKVLQTIGTKGDLRQGAENILANPTILDEVKERVSKLSEYTPETLKQVGLSTAEVLDYYIGEYGEVLGLEKIKSLLDKGEFDGYTEKVAIQQSLIGMYNKLAKFGATEQIRKEALNNAVDVAEQYINQGTGLGRMINAYKLLGSLTTEGRLVWAKRQTNKYVKPAYESLKEDIKNLKAELKDAYKQVDYFFEQTLGREETEGQYNELIAQYQAEIDALKAL